ncbi:MAG: HAMP domain-containing sensor histidine kinase [Polyangiaceae bacterium]
MGSEPRTQRVGVRGQLLVLVAIPIFTTVMLVALFLASRHLAREDHERSLLWHRHMLVIHGSEAAVLRWTLCVERASGVSPHPSCDAERKVLLETRRRAVELAGQFGAEEVNEEKEVDERVSRLLAVGDALLTGKAVPKAEADRDDDAPAQAETDEGTEEKKPENPAPNRVDGALARAESAVLTALAERRQEEEKGSATALARPTVLSERTLRIAVGLSLFGAIAGVLLSAIVAGRLRLRLQKLHDDSARFASGDLTIVASERPKAVRDEVDELSVALNHMAEQLASTMVKRDELESVNEVLTAKSKELEASYQELSRATRVKDEFLGMAWHELRTPLNSIIGFAELLVEQRANVGPKGNTEWAASIARNAQALLGIVNNMLDLTKLESGKFVPVSAPIAVADLVDDLAGLTRALVRGRAIEVESRIEAAEDLVSDPGMLRQILANLLGNAAKFTQTGRITLSVTRAGGRRVFSVRDTGGGIPPEDWERVFERFTQVDQSEVRAHGGTGLGLFIARKLAVALGGDVTLESEVGKGSTFSVSVPEQRHAS